MEQLTFDKGTCNEEKKIVQKIVLGRLAILFQNKERDLHHILSNQNKID